MERNRFFANTYFASRCLPQTLTDSLSERKHDDVH